ncbi:MAG: YfiR family protein [Thauera sp.]|nr:YfiR family protein [Thauera sp.]
MSLPHFCLAVLRALALGAFTAAALAAGGARAADSLEQARVKAAFVLNFMKFTAWPTGPVTASKTIVLCATDSHPLAGQLHELEGREVRDLQVRVVHRTADDSPPCDVIFVTRIDDATLNALRREVAARPILTISDQTGFLEQGGMIEIKLVDGRTRFDINLLAARAAGLTLSSQLLQLAERVVK